MFHPMLIRDPVLRGELSTCILHYFDETVISEVSEGGVWDAFKSVVRGFCIRKMANVKRQARLHRGTAGAGA